VLLAVLDPASEFPKLFGIAKLEQRENVSKNL